jgi:type III pantothenate kinase
MFECTSFSRTANLQLLLVDIGNTHTHLGWANAKRIRRNHKLATHGWQEGSAERAFLRFLGSTKISGAIIASVVPPVTPRVAALIHRCCGIEALLFSAKTLKGLGLKYPAPGTLGADRLANALAARTWFGAPVLAVDFGTATTFNLVDPHGDFIGGAIAPGFALMTSYLHEKTALLPAINMREIKSAIGRTTAHAIQAGALYGYRGLVSALIAQMKKELGCRRLPVVATGGCARFLAASVPEITAVYPNLTLEGLRLNWLNHARNANGSLALACPRRPA